MTRSFRTFCRSVTIASCLAAVGLAGASPALAVRGHEFLFALGWGVADGESRLETCTEACQPGISGAEKGQFSAPVGAAVNEASGDFYVLDAANARVERFGADGGYLGFFDGSGSFEAEGNLETGAQPPTGPLLAPSAIAVDNSCVQLRLTESQCKATEPSNGDVYVTTVDPEPVEHEGVKLSIAVIDKFTPRGDYVGQVQAPIAEEATRLELFGIAIDSEGHLWVADNQGQAHRGFEEFTNASPTNAFVKFVTDEGILFRGPHPGLIRGREGNLFANTNFESPFEEVVRKFTSDGELLGPLQKERTTGVGLDWTTGDLYLDNGLSVGRFTPDLPTDELERFGAGHLVDGSGIAANSIVVAGSPDKEGPVYVADPGAADVVVFTLEGPKPPSIEQVSVADVTADSATLEGTVNPRGARSQYKFEYGSCVGPAECSSSPFDTSEPTEAFVGTPFDFEGHAVSIHLHDLEPGVVYHFRLAARNEKNAEGEFNDSSEVVFRTQPAVPVESRLDGREWEMVSSPHKHGTLIRPIEEADVIQAAASGGAFTYVTDTPTEDELQGFSNFVQVLARRTGPGWISEDVALPHTRATGQSVGQGVEYRFFSEDLTTALVQPLGQFEQATSPQATEQTPYRRSNFEPGHVEAPCHAQCYQPLVSASNVPEGVHFGEEGSCPPRVICGPLIVGASPNGRHVILESKAGLAEGSGGGLFEWSDGVLTRVSMLPNGQPALPSSSPVLGDGTGVTRGAVSGDGSRVVWTGAAGKALFLREATGEEARTVEVNAGIPGVPVFQAASSDGSQVFFKDGAGLDLYVYDVEAGKATRLTTPAEAGEETRLQGQVLGVDASGTSVYFVADGRLSAEVKEGEGTCNNAASANTGHCYLYVASASGGVWGPPKLVATLSGADHPDFSSNLVGQTVRISSDGRWLVFMSQEPLTGYDNRDAVRGVRDEEVFLYDKSSEKLVCVSCDPTGARPQGVEYKRINDGLVAGDRVWPGDAWLAGNVPGWTPYRLEKSLYQSRYLLDDGRVFFNSSDTLVPGDVNGTEDVYEYEPVGVGSCSEADLTFGEASNGCVALISAGSSKSESGFLDASASGGDVFFLTSSHLVLSDTDSAVDVYDAHECTPGSPCIATPPPPGPPCVTEASCKEQPSLQPELFGAPASATFTGLGNVSPVATPPGAQAPSSKAATRKRQLARALAACRHRHAHSRKRRLACERHARASVAAVENSRHLGDRGRRAP